MRFKFFNHTDFKTSSRIILSWFFMAALLVGVVVIYWPVFVNLVTQLATDEDFSYGLLLPLVSAYLVYLKWPQLRRESWRPSWLGLAAMVLGFGFYLVGELAADLFIPRVSFIVVLVGVLCLVGGIKIIRLLWFPLLLLLLMIPLPAMVTKSLTLPLQLMSSRLAAGFLRAMGVPLVLHGNVIDLGVRQIQVVAACSGLRYILALLALGIIFCYFFQRRIWKAVILLISLIPEAIIANALRVAAMGLFPSLQEGFLHTFSGWLIFVFCFAFLGLINWVLNYWSPPMPEPTPLGAAGAQTAPAAGDTPQPSYVPYLISALVLTLAVFPILTRLGEATPRPVLQSFNKFPMQLGNWQGHFAFIAPKMVRATGATAHLNAEFTNPHHGLVTLWIAYYENQKKSRGSIHSPQYCLPGSGWNTIKSGISYVKPGLPVRYMVMEQGRGRLMVYYWYVQQGRWIANEYARKFFMGYEGLVSRRNDCALIRLITPIDQDIAAAQARLTSFARLLVPVMPKFIPQ